jgi:hypothetical protein
MDEKKQIDLQRTVLRLKLEKFILYNLSMDYCPEIHGNIYIYGAGMIGKLLLRSFEHAPAAFIDSKEGLNDINGIKTLCMGQISTNQFEHDDTVIVSPVWDFDVISEKLLSINGTLNVVSLEKILEKI